MTVNLALANFKSTGSTTSRTIGDRAADCINVKDYGATGDGTTDDKAAIQAAIDAAFGTSGSPHGYTNRILNKALYFPACTAAYRITDTLNFTHVYGGKIFGDNISITLSGSGASTTHAAIVTNGMVQTIFEGINLFSGSSSPANFDLDWDGTWSDLPVADTDGLNQNFFHQLSLGTAQRGIRVAATGNDGAFNSFWNVILTSTGSAGIELVGANAIGNMVYGGGCSVGQTGQVGYKVTGGQFAVLQGMGNADNSTGVQIDTAYPCTILGGRAETGGTCIEMSAGLVAVYGFNFQDTNTNLANVTGGKLILDGCFINTGATITGNGGSVYIRGSANPAGLLTSYTGTVVQHI